MLTSDQLTEAWKVVDQADLPEDMREAALREVLRSLHLEADTAGKPRRVSDSKKKDKDGDSGESGDSISEQDMLAEVARQTDVPVGQLEQLVMFEDGELKIVLGNKDVGKKSNAEGTRIVARILTVVGLHGLSRSDTTFDLIRKECERLKVYDSKNFASNHMMTVDGFTVRGTGSSRRLAARSPGLRAFPDLVNQLLGDS